MSTTVSSPPAESSAPRTPPAGALFAQDALLPGGWARDVLLQWDAAGQLTAVAPGSAAGTAPRAPGPVLPGMPNLHSHAFQRAFAGLTEYRAPQPDGGQDSFWSWRNLMYRFAARTTPEHLEAIATWLYVEMLEAGYTAVCEFHYVHHDAAGQPYADDAAMSLALLRAAQAAGIGITLLPVLYQTSGFGGRAPREDQRRFIRSTDSMLALLERLAPVVAAQGGILGLAPHSLRAVPPDSLRIAVEGLTALNATAPVHIHIAEQTQEVDDCIAWSGQRPVQWLLEHAPVDARWCLVHATHMTPDEYAGAARTGAVAGLCPTTEANLGDGLFDLPRWLADGGRWGVGSDSHACVNAAEELMLLEYGQRLSLRQRNVLASRAHPEVATAMALQAVQGGAQASGRCTPGAPAGITVGERADLVALDAQHIALQGLPPDSMLGAHVFGSHRTSALHSLWTAGTPRVVAGRHALHDRAAAAFVAARTATITRAGH
ncbi:formimidoylglutamate deiminase [Acidovorax sp. SUPP3434]|uniref:formimidoylglutamate deiminase n=1 Tax=Acidovorax sp. SUPP3434 TaxID=2920880 RepID=UPI0023DE2ED5|nr:formimidoylglutamate deiminase [Acidovorax sp. SUPP3434]GKS97904.1 formimidoylglutamate deiminase [Acidovorax sp. SUPP3434]